MTSSFVPNQNRFLAIGALVLLAGFFFVLSAVFMGTFNYIAPRYLDVLASGSAGLPALPGVPGWAVATPAYRGIDYETAMVSVLFLMTVFATASSMTGVHGQSTDLLDMGLKRYGSGSSQ